MDCSTNSPYGLGNHPRTCVTGDARIGQHKQRLGTQKSSTNCCHGRRRDSTSQTGPRDSDIINELVSRVTHGLSNPKTLRDSEIINELLSRVTQGFDSPNSPYGLRYPQRSAVTGDARIGQHKQPLGTRKSSTNCCHRCRRQSTAQTATRDSEIINELLSRVTQGFGSPNSP